MSQGVKRNSFQICVPANQPLLTHLKYDRSYLVTATDAGSLAWAHMEHQWQIQGSRSPEIHYGNGFNNKIVLALAWEDLGATRGFVQEDHSTSSFDGFWSATFLLRVYTEIVIVVYLNGKCFQVFMQSRPLGHIPRNTKGNAACNKQLSQCLLTSSHQRP